MSGMGIPWYRNTWIPKRGYIIWNCINTISGFLALLYFTEKAHNLVNFNTINFCCLQILIVLFIPQHNCKTAMTLGEIVSGCMLTPVLILLVGGSASNSLYVTVSKKMFN
jgi:hypothetical protein